MVAVLAPEPSGFCESSHRCASREGGGSLTTEYSANGSFFRPHTRSVHKTDADGLRVTDCGFRHDRIGMRVSKASASSLKYEA